MTVIFLSACTQTPKVDSNVKTQLWLEHQIAISAIQEWKINGRVAVKNEKESGTVSLFWNQYLSDYELRFIAPLGQGTYILTGSAEGVVMQAPKDTIIEADNAEQLLYDILGWDVSLNGLKYWIRGLPEPNVNYTELILDEQGRLKSIEQSRFNISVSTYIELDGFSLPKKLKIKSDNIQLKVIIQNWQI